MTRKTTQEEVKLIDRQWKDIAGKWFIQSNFKIKVTTWNVDELYESKKVCLVGAAINKLNTILNVNKKLLSDFEMWTDTTSIGGTIGVPLLWWNPIGIGAWTIGVIGGVGNMVQNGEQMLGLQKDMKAIVHEPKNGYLVICLYESIQAR